STRACGARFLIPRSTRATLGAVCWITFLIWSVLRRTTTANRAFADPHDLITAVRRGLRQLQYRHDVLDGCLTGTGLTMTTLRIQGQ
ncbi:hypothetical protein ACIBO9_49565, partial [Streptomyces prunicolor]